MDSLKYFYFKIIVLAFFITLFSQFQTSECKRPRSKFPSFSNKTTEANKNLKVFNGANAILGQFPYVAILTYNGAYYCTASIISQNWLITSAWCATDSNDAILNLQLTGVVAGTIDSTLLNNPIPVSRIILMPFYDPATSGHDVALIRVSIPFNFAATPNIRPIALPSPFSHLPSSGVVSSWGLTAAGGTGQTQFLQYATLPIVRLAQCPQPGATHLFCAGTTAVSACSQDEAGPFVAQLGTTPVIFGHVNPFTSSCQVPALFTNLIPYRTWIFLMTGL